MSDLFVEFSQKTGSTWTRRVLPLPWARSVECRNSTQNIHLLLQTLFVTAIYSILLYVCHLPFLPKLSLRI